MTCYSARCIAVSFSPVSYCVTLPSQLHLKSAMSLRALCCKNGGAFIKVGQHLGSLEYLLPGEYVETMKVLHDRAPQSPLDDLKTVIFQDLGVPVSV